MIIILNVYRMRRRHGWTAGDYLWSLAKRGGSK